MKTNHEFLETYLALSLVERSDVAAILPLDKKIIDARLSGIHNENGQDKRITDLDISKLTRKLLAQVVDYPLEDEDRVTLGSQVTISQGDDQGNVLSRLHIVGFSPLYPDLKAASLDAPVTQAIIGHRIGHTTLLYLPKGPQELEIVGLDQTVLSLMDANNYGQTLKTMV